MERATTVHQQTSILAHLSPDKAADMRSWLGLLESRELVAADADDGPSEEAAQCET